MKTSYGLNYRLNCDDYVLHDGDRPIQALCSEVAIVFSFDPDFGWMSYKTGSRENVWAWVKNQEGKFGSDDELFKTLHIIEGKLPVDDLNRCYEFQSHIGVMLLNLQAIDLEKQSGVKKTFLLDGKDISTIGDVMIYLSNSPEKLSSDDVIDVQVKRLSGIESP